MTCSSYQLLKTESFNFLEILCTTAPAIYRALATWLVVDLVCTYCVSFKHNNHKFEPVEQIFSEKLDELKGAEPIYCQDLTLCREKVEEFQNQRI